MVTKPSFFFASVLFGLSILPAYAGWAPKTEEFMTCAAHARATYPRLECYAVEMNKRESAMQAAYNAAIKATVHLETRECLARSQTAWLEYLDAWCAANVPRSGSLAKLSDMDCRLDEIIKRTDALRAYRER